MRTVIEKSIILVILVSFFSCDKSFENTRSNLATKSTTLQKISEYSPPANFAGDIFYGFTSEVKTNNNLDLKSQNSIEDRPIDEVIWLIGALINRNYGFVKDSIEYLVIDTAYHILPIKSFNSDGMPIIEGETILNKYYEIENNIKLNDENEFSFWSLALIVEDYDEEEILIMSVSSGGPKSSTRILIMPLPPGTPMPLFDTNDWLWAGSSPDFGIYHPIHNTASYRFFEKYSQGSPYTYPYEYVYTYSYYHSRSAYIAPGVADNRFIWDNGICASRKMYGPELNQFLLSTKQLIDEWNPLYNGHPDFPNLVIGWFYIYCVDYLCSSPPCPSPGSPYGYQTWFTHRYYGQVYRRTYVGPAE
ncbi:MAG: hypothetical protein Q8J88_17075 [Bacteroidales bacterium]|jgi:hypothetical protein|nr:hypothetical protein [Bacteroidales bacterium]